MISDSTINVIERVPERVMAIGAHPDDVELEAGGTLAKWSRLGSVITLVVCTDGGAGSRNRDVDMDAVVKRRRQEQTAAADCLGVQHVVMLEYPDGGLEDCTEFRGALVRLIREHRPDVVLSHDPRTSNRFIHRDHRITGQVTLDAIYPYARDHLHYPQQIAEGLSVHRVSECLLWDTDAPNVVVDISDDLEFKARALEQHASQLRGILGDTDPINWLRKRSEESAAGFNFADAEAFRSLHAPP
jgi:LmbE family N-acetylglucosaminyl deacetylase